MFRIGAAVIGKESDNRRPFTHQPRAGSAEVEVGARRASLDPCSFPQKLLCTQSMHFKQRGNGRTVGTSIEPPRLDTQTGEGLLSTLISSVVKRSLCNHRKSHCVKHLSGVRPTPQRQKICYYLRCTICLNGKKTKDDI